jgi:L-ribulose-5-phosphate 3-epimerase
VNIAVMQGRLSASETGALQEFPRREWEEEFPRAAAAGLRAIEWLYDDHGSGANPLETDAGIERMRELSATYGVEVRSLCVHRLLQRHELDVDWLLGRCVQAGIELVVLPFLEGRPIDDDLLRRRGSVEVLVESDIELRRLAAIADRLGVGVNYDTGNQRGHGIEELGPRIGGVHLKDRDEAGANVPLGEGTVDFRAVFAAFRAVGYAGDLVLETPRPRRGEEVALARRQVAFVEEHLG